MRWSEAGYLSRIVLAHAPRQASVSLIFDVRHGEPKQNPRNRTLLIIAYRQTPMLALLIIFISALMAEVTAIVRYAFYSIPLGRGFGYSILAQVTLPVLLFAAFTIWGIVSPPNYGLEPLSGEALDRSWNFIGALFWIIFLTSVIAGLFGAIRFLDSRHKTINTKLK